MRGLVLERLDELVVSGLHVDGASARTGAVLGARTGAMGAPAGQQVCGGVPPGAYPQRRPRVRLHAAQLQRLRLLRVRGAWRDQRSVRAH